MCDIGIHFEWIDFKLSKNPMHYLKTLILISFRNPYPLGYGTKKIVKMTNYSVFCKYTLIMDLMPANTQSEQNHFYLESGLYYDHIFYALVSGHSKDESKQIYYWVIFWLMDYSCLTWQPRRMASCTGPSVGMSAWQLSAPFEQSAGTDKQKKINQYGREKPDMFK